MAFERLAPQQHYEKACAAYDEQDYEKALSLFGNFLERYPDHELADNAQYWLGEIYYDMKDYPRAIRAFMGVATRYGEENKAPDALLKIGYTYVVLNDLVKARMFLRQVIEDYPLTEAGAKARAKLQEIGNR